jgi:hypothetical protein
MPVKCADCGLLQILKFQTREFVAVEPVFRESADMAMITVPKVGPTPIYERQIECLARRPIRSEIDAVPSGVSWKDHFKEVINRPRTTCDDVFVQFQPGLSPKDHLEMKLLAEVERRNAAWRDEEIQRAKDWRADDIKWREDTEQRLGGRHVGNFVLQGLQIIGTIIGSVVASLIAVGKIQLW